MSMLHGLSLHPRKDCISGSQLPAHVCLRIGILCRVVVRDLHNDSRLWGICGAVIAVLGVATAGITVWLIRKEKREFEAKTMPA